MCIRSNLMWWISGPTEDRYTAILPASLGGGSSGPTSSGSRTHRTTKAAGCNLGRAPSRIRAATAERRTRMVMAAMACGLPPTAAILTYKSTIWVLRPRRNRLTRFTLCRSTGRLGTQTSTAIPRFPGAIPTTGAQALRPTHRAVANFLHVSTAPGTVTVDEPVVVGLMNFSNTNKYTLASVSASNNITINNSGSNSLIEVLQGSHEIDAPMVLDGNGVLDLSLDMAGTFTITGNISEAAAGTGVLNVDAYSTGTLLLSGTNTYSSTEVLGGTLVVQHPYSLGNGSNLIVGNAASTDFASMAAAIAAVPEPGTLALLAAGGPRRCWWSAAGGGHSHRACSVM